MSQRMDEEIGPKHYRAASGRYLEEFSVGDIYEHHPGRTVSQQDNAWVYSADYEYASFTL